MTNNILLEGSIIIVSSLVLNTLKLKKELNKINTNCIKDTMIDIIIKIK
jgi:hypothetical protein